jgi:ribosomal subunit interface protein
MRKKVTFQNMDHSSVLEEHANQKLIKVEELLSGEESLTPHFIEVWLKANSSHPHHSVEIHLKTPIFDLHAHDEGTDIYVALDNSIDKMVKQLHDSKAKIKDKEHKVENEKRKFEDEDDKYTLSD